METGHGNWASIHFERLDHVMDAFAQILKLFEIVHDFVDDLQQGNAIILSSRVLSTQLDLTHKGLSAPSHPVFSHFVKNRCT